MIKVSIVVLLCQDEKWGVKVWGKEQIFARNFADVGKMWGKPRNEKSLNPLISRV